MAVSIDTPITEYARLTPVQKNALDKLRIKTIEDLLYHFPQRYGDTAEVRSIDSLIQGDQAVVYGKMSNLKASKGFKTKMTMATGYVEDESGRINCVWFNQPYVANMFKDDMLVRIEGKVSERRRTKGELYFSNPKIERIDCLPIGVGDSLFGEEGESHTMYPVYPESRGISSSWIYHTLQKIFKSGLLDEIVDPLPGHILVKYHLPSLKTALIWIHTPLKREDALAARKRFSFEEVFIIQLGKQRARKQYADHPAFLIETPEGNVREFVRRFPFQATTAQTRAIDTILEDMRRDKPMARLLEGDVGSGKTAVAAATSFAVMASRPAVRGKNNKVVVRHGISQIAYMCPTEILATQHFESFIQFFSYMPVQIGLITSSGCRKFPSKVNPKGWTDISRNQLLKWVQNGEIAVLIGTHALIQKSVVFKNLAYVIIDEQHRFGTSQRSQLIKKNSQDHSVTFHAKPSTNNPQYSIPQVPAPHLLSMTATPIPRTLALTLYGDLDLTLLDEIPAGRKPIITELVLPDARDAMYAKIRTELEAGRQAYVICPRINEPDPTKEIVLNAKSVKEEAKRLKRAIFPEYEIGILHSKMTPTEKDKVMTDFKNGKIHILCATSVVEVGVNVPNATVIIIEGAERFGVAQLHQLRGRVMRSTHQAYCFVFTETSSAKSIERLKALQTAKNGFELAELDLSQRGPGELSGAKQWGVSDVAMEALKNLKMVEAAHTESVRIINEDPDLARYPELRKQVDRHSKEVHLE